MSWKETHRNHPRDARKRSVLIALIEVGRSIEYDIN